MISVVEDAGASAWTSWCRNDDNLSDAIHGNTGFTAMLIRVIKTVERRWWVGSSSVCH